MTPADTGRVLVKAAAYDQRTIGEADVLAWHEILGDLDPQDCLDAVAAHYAESTDRLMPAHVRRHALAIARERHRLEREAREAEQAAIEAAERGTTTDRTADVLELVRQVRDVLPAGRPDKLRYGLGRHRAPRAPAEPNPHFRGWHTPPDLSDPTQESA